MTVLCAAAALAIGGGAATTQTSGSAVPPPAAGSVRFATFNAALNGPTAGAILRRLESGTDAQAARVAEVIQRVRPDVLVLQELDRDPDGRALAAFAHYLSTARNSATPIDYPHRLFPPSNTGVPTGVDLDGDGVAQGPADARGFGRHAGQYAFAVLSRLPLGPARTFASFLWRDMPGNVLPSGYYSAAALDVLPLSSKTHLAVPVQLADGGTIHVLAAHPTPPVFDVAPIDWNGRRNADEIRLLVDLLAPSTSGYIVDDDGRPGGLPAGANAVVMGDLNADPVRGDSRPGAIDQLLASERVTPVVPLSPQGPDTADFRSVGRMRVDYVQPTAGLEVTGSGVFWPADDDPLSRLNAASDHHLVWVDVRPR